MEINLPSQDNSDRVVLISDSMYDEDHHHQQQQQHQHQQHQQQRGGQKSQVRSYECTFCKRGFSNAQALGGHMNIHRKDKAKLKQSSSKPTPNHLPPKNWPWIFSDPVSIDYATPTMFRHDQSTTSSTTRFAQHQQFPWYSETRRYGNQESGGRGFFASSSKEKVVMGEDNLDLELRLGHGPSNEDHSPGATGMMKFL